MAKKKKTQVPTPPRQVQAPRQRRDPTGPRKRGFAVSRFWLATVGVILVAAGAVVGIALALGGGDDDGGASAAAAGCVRQDYPPMGRQHVNEVQPDFEYNSFPPTSGPHFPETAIWNVYNDPPDRLRLIHNLEHGGVIVQYGLNVPRAQVDGILDWYSEDPNGLIVAPLPELGDSIALTAWTHLMTCSQGFNEEAFSDFRDDYRFEGPEPFPPDALRPGNF